jgi:hypothetical protein
MMSAAETASASQIRNRVSTVGDFRSRSRWLMYGRESPARNPGAVDFEVEGRDPNLAARFGRGPRAQPGGTNWDNIRV